MIGGVAVGLGVRVDRGVRVGTGVSVGVAVKVAVGEAVGVAVTNIGVGAWVGDLPASAVTGCRISPGAKISIKPLAITKASFLPVLI